MANFTHLNKLIWETEPVDNIPIALSGVTTFFGDGTIPLNYLPCCIIALDSWPLIIGPHSFCLG